MQKHLQIVLAFTFSLIAGTAATAGEAAPPIDVLLRLKNVDLAANPTVRAALDRALASTRGTPQFLELVRAFNLTDQTAGLLALAVALPGESAGAEALQRVIEDGGIDAIRQALAGEGAAAVAQALGNVADEAAPGLLTPIVADAARPLTLRQAAVRSLARTEEGAGELLALARQGKVSADVKPLAGTELANVMWPEIKDEAARLLPAAAAPASGDIPPLETVLALRGDAGRGEKLFQGPAACATCHQVNGRGVDFGPGLSEIGDKYGKQALYSAIVDPSAGISFGYELWQISLKGGTAVGFIASETDDEIQVKAPGNILTRYRKSDVTARKSLPGSIMPAGLLSPLGAQGIADLLEYLSTLKKPR